MSPLRFLTDRERIDAVIRAVVHRACPDADPPGVWILDGERGNVTLRFNHDGNVYQVSTWALAFDWSDPPPAPPRLVLTDLPRIPPAGDWNPTFGGYVRTRMAAYPVEWIFDRPT